MDYTIYNKTLKNKSLLGLILVIIAVILILFVNAFNAISFPSSMSPFSESDHYTCSVKNGSQFAPLTIEVHQWIYDKMHPGIQIDCKQAKYIAIGDIQTGFGSLLHQSGAALAVALEKILYIFNVFL